MNTKALHSQTITTKPISLLSSCRNYINPTDNAILNKIDLSLSPPPLSLSLHLFSLNQWLLATLTKLMWSNVSKALIGLDNRHFRTSVDKSHQINCKFYAQSHQFCHHWPLVKIRIRSHSQRYKSKLFYDINKFYSSHPKILIIKRPKNTNFLILTFDK